MQFFDRIDARKLDRRDAELWTLAITMILVLCSGMAVVMYVAVNHPVTLTGASGKRIFFGFCALSVLLVSYLTERQITVRRLRKELKEERTRSSYLLAQASTDLLESLPSRGQFVDRLAMDFRRAASLQQPLSLVIARLKASSHVSAAGETSRAYGDAAKALIRRLRDEDSVYLLSAGVFSVLLPGVRGNDANRVVGRLSEGLADAAGTSRRFSFDLQLVNFPDQVATAREMEEVAHASLGEGCLEAQPVA